MFNPTVDLNNYLKPRIVEHLISGGNKTSIKDSTKVNKSFENNQKINRSMMVESVTKLVNNVANEVMQKNTSSAAAAAGASNTLMLTGINCDEIEISGISQKATATADVLVKSQQSNVSKISTELSTTIDKTIEKVGQTDLAALQAENTKQLNDFMKAMPGYDPDKAQKLASKCPKGGGLLSAGNKCDVSTEYELNASVKQALDLDESFKINDQDDVSNDIKNKVEQANFASCQANATAANAIILQDIQCGVMSAVNQAKKEAASEASGKPVKKKLTISDVQQDAMSKLYMTCVFDQKNVSEIANKITNSITKKYNQIYDAVNKKGQEKGEEWLKKKMDLLDTFTAAGVEQIMAAAGDLPKVGEPSKTKTADSQNSSSKNTENKSDKKGTESAGDSLPERKGLGPDNSQPSGPNRLDDYRSKESKKALDEAKEVQKRAEADAEKTKQKAMADADAAKKKAEADAEATKKKAMADAEKSKKEALEKANQEAQITQWLVYGGVILGIIIVLVIVMFMFKSKAKQREIVDDSEE